MFKKLPYLLCLFLLGCQVAELVGPSLAGLIAYPVVRLKEAFEKDSDDFYDKTIKDREKAKKEQEELLCAEKEGDLEKAAALLPCTGCQAWVKPTEGPDSKCSKKCPDWCARVCPNNFDIMKQSRELAVPYKENTLPIGNFS